MGKVGKVFVFVFVILVTFLLFNAAIFVIAGEDFIRVHSRILGGILVIATILIYKSMFGEKGHKSNDQNKDFTLKK